jgi:hypothetical protein
LLKEKAREKNAVTTWVQMGKYVLYVLLLPEREQVAAIDGDESNNGNEEYSDLVEKLQKLPEIYESLDKQNRPAFSEMETLHWLDIDGLHVAADKKGVAKFADEDGFLVEVSVSNFLKTVRRVKVLEACLQQLRETGQLTPLPSPLSQKQKQKESATSSLAESLSHLQLTGTQTDQSVKE